MAKPIIGNRVSIHYIGTLDNGKIFDSTEGKEPLAFTMGGNEIFPALEQAVSTMKVGEVKNLTIAAADAFGPRRMENLLKVSRAAFPPDRALDVGQKLTIDFSGGASRIIVITDVTETEVALDGNHPLAGLDLTFALKLVAIDD